LNIKSELWLGLRVVFLKTLHANQAIQINHNFERILEQLKKEKTGLADGKNKH
jgi:hypothetical protein